MFRHVLAAIFAGVLGSAVGAESHAASGSDTGVIVADEAALERAETIFGRSCRACHGNRAQGVASYPGLNDKDAEYIAERLITYRAGERIGPNSVLMIQNARDLSDEEIAGLAVYISIAFD